MKKILVQSLSILLLISSGNLLLAQCPYDNTLYKSGDGPTEVGEILVATDCWGGDLLHLTNLKAGYTYRFSGCDDPSFDSEITIYPAGGGNALAYDDDGCGTVSGPSSIDFTCPSNGDYDILIDEYPCLSGFTNMDIEIELISTGNGGGSTTFNIPVVVHVLYNTDEQNISDQQIMSQIDVLNEDYRKMNTDFEAVVQQPFQSLAADFKIQFCLASVDPNGNATNGITRTFTNVNGFDPNDGMKHASSGGHDNWDPAKYLNIWVCNLGGGLLGYATFPADLQSDPTNDGVVILYGAFGRVGNLFEPYDLGRTATHEVGHWLNLRHIWGDANCGNDFVDDTPAQQDANTGCPSYPHVTCSNGPNGDMWVNFMDYTDDACMAMFTQGQKARVDATISGSRSSLGSSNGCSGSSVGIEEVAKNDFKLYPNPSNGTFRITFNSTSLSAPAISAFDMLGKNIGSLEVTEISGSEYELHLSGITPGIYFIRFTEGINNYVKRFVVE